MNHKFPYKWNLADGYPADGIERHKAKVFGTFICGGGSTMGYKLAGYEHLGGVEIDRAVAEVYKENHSPKYLFNEDIRDFRQRQDLPDELFQLDILDGSPPCSSFSMAGNREKDWSKKKVFREGQTSQVLDDLFFEYIALAKRLQPKIVLAENVKGLIQGNAKAYVKKIYEAFQDAGYKAQLFLLNAASMGVPQKRERVFFIAQRNGLGLPKLELNFNEESIPFSRVEEKGQGKEITGKMRLLWNKKLPGEKNLAAACEREFNQRAYFGTKIQSANDVPFTLIASDSSPIVKSNEPLELSDREVIQIGTFPLDYNFKNLKAKYLIGMSVPPVMTAQISHSIYTQWIKRIDG